MNMAWYVLHTQTGYEEKVKNNIENKLKDSPLKEYISQIMVATEKVSEVKDGKKKITDRKIFPGYVMIEMQLNDKTWYLVRNIPGVTGFISSGTKPLALGEDEVAQILKQAEEKKEKPVPKVTFEKDESVRVTEGPFTNFTGHIEEINPAKGKLKVMVSIFGRATPLELEYWQVEKI